TNPLPFMTDYTIIDGITGHGQYVGTYMAWGVNNAGWWGEGEIKFYLDGDDQWPTICGTGTEDYFGGAWNFEHPKGEYGAFSTPFLGLPQIIMPDGLYRSQQRFGMYRWHIMDPIRFQSDLRVTIQALGWRSSLEEQRRYLPLQDDIASTVFWYQAEPHAPFPDAPSLNDLEVV
ncbi:MAG TPA: glycoside hydrolase family 172 protein, partial [Thermomicrobiales bacterium]|nr:glycoside hydrolase family 172 protein [Thermomicrobiales bacterium]